MQTVDKAVELLFHLHATPQPQGVTGIGQALGMPKSSAHRLLASLARRHLVERDAGGRYRLGAGLIALGQGVLDREPLVAAARPVLEEEAESLGETVFLVGARAAELVVLDKAEGTGFLRAAPRVGECVPVHATAVGKLYLAFDGERFALPEPDAERFTPRTLAAEALASEVAVTRERGFAANLDEWITGLSVLAAPVFAAPVRSDAGPIGAGRLRGAVAVAVPSPRIAELGVEALAQRVMAAGALIANRLEGRAT